MSKIQDKLIEAIQQRKIIYIYYEGVDGKSNYGYDTISKGYRTIEPYLIGETTAGNIALRAWQQNGASDSFRKLLHREYRPDHDKLPGWRLFYLDGITAILPTGRNFSNSRYRTRPDYNQNDKQMRKIIEFIDINEKSPIKTKGLDSLTKSDGVEIDAKKGDIRKNTTELKKLIINYYELITKHRKKSPRDYYLVYSEKKGIIAVREKTMKKFDNENVIGNLKDLFIKYNKSNRPTRAFFDNQRSKFLKKMRKSKN